MPYLYHDLEDNEASMGWCCQRAGGIDIDCGSRSIDRQDVTPNPDEYTPKSSDFLSMDLALMACMQKTANCGVRNQTLESVSDTTQLRATGLNENEMCSWIVKVECGLPKVTVQSKSASFDESNTKVLYVEW